MSGLSSPVPRFLPPMTPRRIPSPIMSPGTRRGRGLHGPEENRLRQLSPNATLRAFTEDPVPFDTSRDEHSIFACITTLTPAEKELGTRVARAAQKLQSWCQELEQWSWPGTFAPPSDAQREQRRRSLEARIREHVDSEAAVASMAPLQYWGSLLSVEVEAHDTRLDEISDEILALDIEELKEHVLAIHGPDRSRPLSTGFDASRQRYMPLDDFSFLITQTLLSALPNHIRIKDTLSTWTARVAVLRQAPGYLDHLKTAQRAMQLGWDALEPPTDTSDEAFAKWTSAVETISGVLQGKISLLGQRLDGMLDTLEGREDCLPDNWIDVFEGIEADFGKWSHDSRRKTIEFDLRRKMPSAKALLNVIRSPLQARPQSSLDSRSSNNAALHQSTRLHSTNIPVDRPRSVTAIRTPVSTAADPHSIRAGNGVLFPNKHTPIAPSSPESVFEEGDTVVHNELDELEESSLLVLSPAHSPSGSLSFSHGPVIVTDDIAEAQHKPERPYTPRSRRGSTASISSNLSMSSSPPGVEDSPSLRHNTTRQAKAPRPELNAAMGKRRGVTVVKELSEVENPPWPPTQFSKQLSTNTGDELDRKISDILNTIPAHIRLKSAKGTELQKSARSGLTAKGSKGYLRAARSISGMKSPELTLSRAKQDADSSNTSSGRKSAALRADNDIKLYHLSQPGKEHPIKLFIRRVGENGERVMVRVGGGWADLGEYLRQYAEHHGRRAVSDGKFEILGLEVKQSESPRPESVMSKRERRISGTVNSPSATPQKRSGNGISTDETAPPMPSFTNTPTDGNGKASAPSTTSSSHSWTGNEVGLAGPKTKKLDLSGEKLEWIEGMMKQARTVSSGNMTAPKPDLREDGNSRAESRTGSRKSEFGDLGKVGGTKRIFMKGGGLSDH